MKKFLKVLSLALAVSMLFSFAALAEEKPILYVGTNAEFPPFEYVNDDGEFDGFDVAFMQAICEIIGYDMEIVNMEFGSLPNALETGKINAIIAALTISEERAKSMLFTDAYFQATQKLIVPAGSEIVEPSPELKVGVQMGTTGDIYVTDLYGEDSENVVRYSKAIDAVVDMLNGRLDCVMVDEGPAAYFIAAFEGTQLVEADFSDEQYGIGVTLGDQELADQINAAIAQLIEDGTYDEIYALYFGTVETEEEAE